MRVASLAVSACLFGLSLLLPVSALAPSAAASSPAVASSHAGDAASAAPLSVAELALGCGETRCTRDADCPSTCGGCITWSGTCALFRPQ
jgi:hypothetical protein